MSRPKEGRRLAPLPDPPKEGGPGPKSSSTQQHYSNKPNQPLHKDIKREIRNCPAQEPDIHQEWQPGNYHPSISWWYSQYISQWNSTELREPSIPFSLEPCIPISQKTCGPDTYFAIKKDNLWNSLQMCGPGTFVTIRKIRSRHGSRERNWSQFH